MSGNAVARRQVYRVTLIIRCPHLALIDGKEVEEEERVRVENYFNNQNNPRDENSVKSIASSQPMMISTHMLGGIGSSVSKLPIKIKSVVLDGVEMKLSSSSVLFGGKRSDYD